jgi:hypothetical protein
MVSIVSPISGFDISNLTMYAHPEQHGSMKTCFGLSETDSLFLIAPHIALDMRPSMTLGRGAAGKRPSCTHWNDWLPDGGALTEVQQESSAAVIEGLAGEQATDWLPWIASYGDGKHRHEVIGRSVTKTCPCAEATSAPDRQRLVVMNRDYVATL